MKIKTSKLKLIVLFIVILVFIGSSISGCYKTQTNLPAIKFPEFGGFTPDNFEIKLNVDTSHLPEQYIVYKVVPYKVSKSTIKKLATTFGIDLSKVKMENDKFTIWEQNGKRLCIYNTGAYEFTAKNSDANVKETFVPAKEECINIAKEFVEKNKLLPDTFDYHIKIGSETTFHPTFNKSILIDRTVSFVPVLNGTEITGTEFLVTIGDRGKIKEVSNYLFGVKPLKQKYALKPISDILKNLKEGVPAQWWIKPDKPGVKEIVVKHAEILYYGYIGMPLEIKQKFIQPVYRLSGDTIYKDGSTGKFIVTVSALAQ